MIKINLQTETCHYITASNLAREFYDLGLDDAGDAIDGIVGSADLASNVEGEIGHAMVSVSQLVKILRTNTDCEQEVLDTIKEILGDQKIFIDIYN